VREREDPLELRLDQRRVVGEHEAAAVAPLRELRGPPQCAGRGVRVVGRLAVGDVEDVRAQTRVKVVDRNDLTDRTLEVFNPDEKAEVLQGLLVEVDESYSHCPRALTFSRLWNIDEISKNIAEPPVGVKESGI